MRLQINPEDILRSVVLEPGWYKTKIKDVAEEPSKKGDSTNYVVDFVVVSGPTQKEGRTPVGVPIRRYYSEKAPGFVIPLFKAFGIIFDGSKAVTVDFEGLKGKELEVYVLNQRDLNGVMRNVAEDFRL